MAHQYTFDQIEEYLDGDLNEADRTRFEEEMEADIALSEDVKRHLQTRKINELHVRNKVMEKVKSIHQQVKAEEASGGFSVMKIAAGLALFIVAGMAYLYLDNSYSASKMVESAFDQYPNRFRTMSDEMPGDFMKAMEFYDTENYRQALELFGGIPQSDPYYLPSLFYGGVAKLALQNSHGAIDAFQQVLAEESELYSDAAYWYLSLAYISDGQEEKAKELLQQIIDKDGYQALEAQIILKRLNSNVRKLPGIE